MEVRFRNNTSSSVNVAVMFYAPDACAQDGQWGTRGWWVIGPGSTAHVLNTGNRYFCFYAESADGVWAGEFGPVHIYRDSFDSCLLIGSTASIGKVGMRRIDTRGNDIIVNLNR
ncbi:DUF1036 domain-containing protein [Arthrobacter hankyongi]|uniref:DUF1036 domain-containing protein n=1 Tax=Arthrobacter hankyongi TaxID=2904801 RepID=UPI0027E0D493|nr:DUF1036 domain-containing protein [Arthrobacter hankyongi]